MVSASPEQLMLLHHELAALVRAGLPLDRGLRSLSADLPGKLGALANELAERVEKGESIGDVIQSGGSPEQRVYAAVIAAGIRSGDMGAALQSVVAAARTMDQLRRTLWIELLYPALLLVLGYGLLAWSLLRIVPADVNASHALDVGNPAIDSLTTAHDWMRVWGILPAILAVVCLGLFVAMVRSITSPGPQSRSGRGLLAQFKADHALARFFDLLALMVQQRVPLPQAVSLAGEAAGWNDLAKATAALSERLKRGEKTIVEPPIPATLEWLLNSDASSRSDLYRREADHYRRSAERRAQWLSRWLPLVLTVSIGGGFLVLLAVVNLGPFLNALWQLSRSSYR